MQLVKIKLEHVGLERNFELRLKFFPQSKKLSKSTWHQALSLVLPLDSIGFARTSLTVREDAHVESVEGTLHEGLAVLEDLILRGTRAEARVKRVFLVLKTTTTLVPLSCTALNGGLPHVLFLDANSNCVLV